MRGRKLRSGAHWQGALNKERLRQAGWCKQGLRVYIYMPTNLLKPTGHVMHQQFNIRQLYVLPTLYLCVLYLSENKQRLLPLTA